MRSPSSPSSPSPLISRILCSPCSFLFLVVAVLGLTYSVWKLSTEKKNALDEISELKAAAEYRTSQMTDFQNALVDRDASLKRCDEAEDSLKRQLDEIKAEQGAMKEQEIVNEETLIACQSDLEKANDQLNELTEQRDQQVKDLEEVNDQLNELTEQRDQQVKDLEEKGSLVKDLEDKVNNLQSELATLKQAGQEKPKEEDKNKGKEDEAKKAN